MILKDDNESGAILTEVLRRTAVIRINRPSERNSLSASTLRELKESVSTLSARSDVESIIFTGTNDVFASGADIRELRTLSTEAANTFALMGQQLFQEIAGAKQITIAAINGFCMGGGLDLALACDFRFASSNAVFAHPGARLGIITGWGGTQRLPRLIGTTRSLEILLTARRVNSTEALEIGLVNRVADPVFDLALEFAEKIRQGAKESLMRD
ncbi:MAG TPA: enoyl-CoA hydratase/isomerase family protein [Pyrinomonadaceae bacterium]|nr:enoyl-CoA hydratase/isomerase family protein [Pyrinomonadaceae bacterium]